jgi:aminomethyltransferase
MVDFAGWEMPVQYSSIVDEHTAVRTAVGLFDISHMGRLQFRGDASEAFLNRVLTNDTSKLNIGDVRYSLVCREDGGILDDVLMYRFPDRWELVVNAFNRDKIVTWLAQCPGFSDLSFQDRTLSTAMIAVQGPGSVSLLQAFVRSDIREMKYYSTCDTEIRGTSCTISRTGYTGEDGFEIVLPASAAEGLWQRLIETGATSGLKPAGLGCRDTLRLEAAMPLYGHELNESIDPLTAGLQFAVKWNKPDFIGKAALEAIRDRGLRQIRVGLSLEGRRIARELAPILVNGSNIGYVTSGTFSPTLQTVIAMACVSSEYGHLGCRVDVDLRGTLIPATVVQLPFYRRKS